MSRRVHFGNGAKCRMRYAAPAAKASESTGMTRTECVSAYPARRTAYHTMGWPSVWRFLTRSPHEVELIATERARTSSRHMTWLNASAVVRATKASNDSQTNRLSADGDR